MADEHDISEQARQAWVARVDSWKKRALRLERERDDYEARWKAVVRESDAFREALETVRNVGDRAAVAVAEAALGGGDGQAVAPELQELDPDADVTVRYPDTE